MTAAWPPAWFRAFADAIDAGDAFYLACENCGTVNLPPRTVCASCASTALTERPLSARGTVASFTEIHVTTPKFDGTTPYTVVVAAFDEGVALTGQLRGGEPVGIGDAVVLGVEALDDGSPLLVFEPEATDG